MNDGCAELKNNKFSFYIHTSHVHIFVPTGSHFYSEFCSSVDVMTVVKREPEEQEFQEVRDKLEQQYNIEVVPPLFIIFYFCIPCRGS